MLRSAVVVGAVAFAGLTAPRAALGAGASVAFTTYEAEAAQLDGNASVVRMTELPTRTTWTPEYEASGRAFVALTQTGDALEWPGVRAADRAIVRFCVPDAPTGGGAAYTLSLYVDGAFRQKITLHSQYAWLYGNPGENGQSNNPADGVPHVFWDDHRLAIEGEPLREGADLRLQKDADDDAEFYRIDLIDLETAPPPLPTPEPGAYLDVTAAPYGAAPDDGADDAPAFQRCLDDAAAAQPKKIVWVPEGEYHLASQLKVPGVTLQGRGYWHTRLVAMGKVRAVQLSGEGPRLLDLTLSAQDGLSRRDSTYGIMGSFLQTHHWAIERCWVQHTGAGIWMSGSNHGVVRDCRVYNTYADGINLNRGSSHNLVEQNYTRGTGDDGIAFLSEVAHVRTANPVSAHNTARFNTVIAPYWGRCLVMSGGGPHVYEDNYLADSTGNTALFVALESAYDMHPMVGADFRRNVVVRGGGNNYGQKRAAVLLRAGNKDVVNLTFTETTIIDPIFRAVGFIGHPDHSITATFDHTTIQMANPREPAVIVHREVRGSATFTGGSITGAFSQPFVNDNPGFELTHSGF